MSITADNIIKFGNDGTHYAYFQFVLAVLNAAMFENALEPVIREEGIPARL